MTSSPRPRRRTFGSDRFYPLIGLATVVVLIVAVYISYNANTGTPFERYDQYTVDLPNANRLVKAAEVRAGGVRVGQIKRVEVFPAERGVRGSVPFTRAYVQVPRGSLKVPVDTIASVRPASVLGSTYLDLELGSSRGVLRSGGNLPARQARATVELTDLLDLFDKRTASDLQRAITSVGGGLNARGTDLGTTLSTTNTLMPDLRSVAANLASPATRLGPFVASLGRFTGALAAERRALGGGVEGAALTFGGLDRSREALDRLADISTKLLPAAERLPVAATTLAGTVDTAIPALRLFGRGGNAARDLGPVLRNFAGAPEVDGLLRKAASTGVEAGPLVTSIKDAQVFCNSVTTATSYLASTFADDGIGKGPAVVSIRIKGLGGNPLELLQNGKTLPGVHTNYQPKQDQNECEAGNEPYDALKISVTNPPGNQSRAHIKTSVDPELDRQAKTTGLLSEPPRGVKP
jgi:ABC-type transporter Mla subunit MlaD